MNLRDTRPSRKWSPLGFDLLILTMQTEVASTLLSGLQMMNDITPFSDAIFDAQAALGSCFFQLQDQGADPQQAITDILGLQ